MAAEIDAFLKTVCLRPHTPLALDFGCGPGFFTNGLRSCGWLATGYDVSEWAVRSGRSPYVTGDPKVLGMSHQWCFALDVLEHLTEGQLVEFLTNLDARHLLVRVPVCGEPGGPYLLPSAEADPTHVLRKTKPLWDLAFGHFRWRKAFRLNLNTIWDSEGVLVAVYEKG